MVVAWNTAARRGHYEKPTKGFWRSLTMTATAACRTQRSRANGGTAAPPLSLWWTNQGLPFAHIASCLFTLLMAAFTRCGLNRYHQSSWPSHERRHSRFDGPVWVHQRLSASPFSIVRSRRLAVRRWVPGLPTSSAGLHSTCAACLALWPNQRSLLGMSYTAMLVRRRLRRSSAVGAQLLRTGSLLKTCATTIKTYLESLSGPQLRKDWMNVPGELIQGRRTWSASIWNVVNSIGDAC